MWTEGNQDLPSERDRRFHSGLHDGLLVVHDLRGSDMPMVRSTEV